MRNLKTAWTYRAGYNNGYIRTGVNRSPEKERPEDVIRLKIRTRDGTGDCDLQLTVGEALDIATGMTITVTSILEKEKS